MIVDGIFLRGKACPGSCSVDLLRQLLGAVGLASGGVQKKQSVHAVPPAILLSLYHPQHGYGIMQQTEQLSGGRVHLAAGTLYGALTSLCEKGWIRPLPAESGSRKKEYQLTAEGVQVLKHELARLQQLVANGESILKEEAL